MNAAQSLVIVYNCLRSLSWSFEKIEHTHTHIAGVISFTFFFLE